MKKTASPEHQLYADDLTVGQIFHGEARQIGDEHFSIFAALTGDNHPIHYDDEYASRTQFGKRLAHGLLLNSFCALGATPMSHHLKDAMIAFVEQSSRFLRPVFVGDFIASRFEVTSIERKPAHSSALVRLAVTLAKENGDTVLEGSQTYLLKLGGDRSRRK